MNSTGVEKDEASTDQQSQETEKDKRAAKVEDAVEDVEKEKNQDGPEMSQHPIAGFQSLG